MERYRYTPFGKQSVYNAADTYIGTASAYGNPYMFTARRYDPETGLYYYRARMYSPTLGRFLQPDPIGYFDSMNLYQYCGNNPLNWVDPTGKFIGAVIGGAIFATSVAWYIYKAWTKYEKLDTAPEKPTCDLDDPDYIRQLNEWDIKRQEWEKERRRDARELGEDSAGFTLPTP